MPLSPFALVRRSVDTLAAVAELAAPRVCGACGRPGIGGALCDPCRALLDDAWFAGGPKVVGRVRGAPCAAAGPYDGVARAVLHAYKDEDRRDVWPVLAPRLLEAIDAARTMAQGSRGPVVLVPAPSSASANRSRGDRPVEILARRAAAASEGVAVVPALVARRKVADQSTLGRAGRARNVAGAYAVRPSTVERLRGASVVLVDDVVTSGATLGECARSLTEAGIEVSCAATVLATPRPRQRRSPASTERSVVWSRTQVGAVRHPSAARPDEKGYLQ